MASGRTISMLSDDGRTMESEERRQARNLPGLLGVYFVFFKT
jgi:hypothetical protein